ncbi:MAG: MFS transporter [Chloroflexi bacterium]|nr:MFS transporter [Chloroflexota bacterium]
MERKQNAIVQSRANGLDESSSLVETKPSAQAQAPDVAIAPQVTKVSTTGDAPAASFGSVLRQPAVRALWLASFISYVGDTFSTIALFILVNDVTNSTVALGAVGAVQIVPLLFAIPAGVMVDRWRYRPVLLATDLVRAALLPLYLLFQSADDLWIVLGVSLVISMASRFFFPASGALRRALLQPKEYSVAASLWQATYGMSYVIGPALAGLLISAFGSNLRLGVTVAFLLDSFSFVVSALLIFLLVGNRARAVDTERQSAERPRTWDDMREGWSIMWRSKPLRGVVLLYGVGLLGVGAVFVLTVPYVQRVFNGGPLEIGILEAAQAFGLAVGATAVGTVFLRKAPPGQLMLGASVAGAIAVIGLGLIPFYVGALLVMCLAGIAAGAVESSGAAITLHEIPQRHQGKGNASINTLLNAAYLTSIALSGIGGDLVGIQGTFVVGGLVALAGVVMALPFLGSRPRPAPEQPE